MCRPEQRSLNREVCTKKCAQRSLNREICTEKSEQRNLPGEEGMVIEE